MLPTTMVHKIHGVKGNMYQSALIFYFLTAFHIKSVTSEPTTKQILNTFDKQKIDRYKFERRHKI